MNQAKNLAELLSRTVYSRMSLSLCAISLIMVGIILRFFLVSVHE